MAPLTSRASDRAVPVVGPERGQQQRRPRRRGCGKRRQGLQSLQAGVHMLVKPLGEQPSHGSQQPPRPDRALVDHPRRTLARWLEVVAALVLHGASLPGCRLGAESVVFLVRGDAGADPGRYVRLLDADEPFLPSRVVPVVGHEREDLGGRSVDDDGPAGACLRHWPLLPFSERRRPYPARAEPRAHLTRGRRCTDLWQRRDPGVR
jgi:hypothetical protein